MSESLRAILDCRRGDLGEFESTRFLIIAALGSSGSLGLSLSEGSLLLGQQLSLLSLDDGAISEYQLCRQLISSDRGKTYSAILVPAVTTCLKASAPFLIVEEEILGKASAPDSSSSLRWGAAAAA